MGITQITKCLRRFSKDKIVKTTKHMDAQFPNGNVVFLLDEFGELSVPPQCSILADVVQCRRWYVQGSSFGKERLAERQTKG